MTGKKTRNLTRKEERSKKEKYTLMICKKRKKKEETKVENIKNKIEEERKYIKPNEGKEWKKERTKERKKEKYIKLND